MRRPAELLALAVGCLRCGSDPALTSPEPPPEIRFLAAVATDPEDGHFVGSSEVVEKLDLWRLELELEPNAPDSPNVEIVGWSEDLWPSSLGSTPRLSRLRPAVACETELPPPAWRQTLQGEAPSVWLKLGTDSFKDICPALIAPGVAEPVHLCGRNYCGQSVHQSGCTIELRSAGCGLERSITPGVVDAYGQLCFPLQEGCRSVEPPASAFRRVECTTPETCVIDWVQTNQELPPLSMRRREVFTTTVGPVQANIAQPTGGEVGPLQELLIAEDRLVVLSRGNLMLGFGLGTRPSTLLTLDPDTLETRSEHALPNGVGALAWSPDRQTIVAAQVSTEAGENAVLKLSLEGEVLFRQTIDFLDTFPNPTVDLFRHIPAMGVIVLSVNPSLGESGLVTLDEDTLAIRSTCRFDFTFNPSDVLPAGPDEIWVAENAGDYLPRVSLSACERTATAEFDTPGNFGMGYFLQRPNEGLVFLTLGGVSGNIVTQGVLEDSGTFPARGASYFESFMIPTRLVHDPRHPRLALAAVHGPDGTGDARVTWFDLEDRLFQRGSLAIGKGMAVRGDTRGDGVFYFLMGRAAAIVRVDTR